MTNDVILIDLSTNTNPLLNGSVDNAYQNVEIDEDFSNLINMMNAKAEEIQTDFVDKAIISNTSSINRFVLNQDDIKTTDTKDEAIKEQNLNPDLKEELKDDILIEDTLDFDKEDTKTDTDTIKEDINPNPKPEITDKNNSTVDPSPVFSSNRQIEEKDEANDDLKTDLNEDNETILKDIIQNVFITFDVDLNENNDINLKIDEAISDIETTNDLIQSIEDISKYTENSNLSNQDKEQIMPYLDKIKQMIKSAQNQLEKNENQNIEEAKKILDNVILKMLSNDDTKEIKAITNEELKSIIKETDIEKENNDLTKDIIKSAQKIADEIDEALENNDSQALFEISKNIDDIKNELLKLFENQKNEDDKEFDLNKELFKALDELNESLVKSDNSNEETTSKAGGNLSSILTEIKNNQNIFSEIQPKTNTKEDLSLKTNTKIETQTQSSKEENIDLNFTNDDFNSDDKENPDFNKDIEVKIDKNLSSKISKTQKTTDTNPIEESLKKFLNTKETIQKISIENNYSKNGALTVTDEVVKLSLEETNNSNTIQGSVVYDSASGNGALINKHTPFFINTSPNTQTDIEKYDIFNQIGSKLQELKNGAQKLTVVLRPHNLGRLSIELTSDNSSLTTHIIAQNDEVRSYIEKNIHSLRQQLNEAGINVNSIQIKTTGQDGASNFEGNQDFEREQSREQNQQNDFQQNKNNQNHKQKQQTLFTMSNYDMNYTKDFSSILNKSLSYTLN